MPVYFLQILSVGPCVLLGTGFALLRLFMWVRTVIIARPAPGTSTVGAVKLGVCVAVTSQVNRRLQIDACQMFLSLQLKRFA